MTDDQTRKVAELIKGERFGFLTTITMDGRLTSRPMTLQEVEFDGDLWFFAERGSRKVQHITAPLPFCGSTAASARIGTRRPNKGMVASCPTRPANRPSSGCTKTATQAGRRKRMRESNR